MRTILFDFGGTLDCPRHWLDRFLSHYHDVGIVVTRPALDLAFEAATRNAYRSAAQLRDFRLAELLHYLVSSQLAFLRDSRPALQWSVDLADPAMAVDLTNRISHSFLEESRRGLARSREVLAKLSRTFAIGVVSNFYGNLDRILSEAGFDGIVSAIADSGQLGIYKPDPRIYEAARARLSAEAATTMMVGDSLDKDCAPAKALGMGTVWLRHREATEPPDSALADFTISDLAELQDLICRIT